MPVSARRQRGAFTLMELLVVIAIIAVLVGLIGAGIFALIGSQRRNNTESTMRMLNQTLLKQVDAVLKKADSETIPTSVINLAGGDNKLAKVIWKKLRLKKEFPMTFAEAVAPYAACSYAFKPNPAWPPASPLSPQDLPPVPAYVKALQNAGLATQAADGSWSVISANNSNNNGQQQFIESSMLLLLALQQNRGGAVLTSDQLGSFAQDVTVNNLKFKIVVDGWNNPLAFFRFPTSNDNFQIPLNNALDSLNTATTGSQATFRDVYDPYGALVNPELPTVAGAPWNSWANFNSPPAGAGVYYFEQLGHLVHKPNATAAATAGTYAPWATYMVPTIVSAGADGKWGLSSAFNGSYEGGSYAGLNPDMSIDGTSAATIAAANDNIYSYRLKD